MSNRMFPMYNRIKARYYKLLVPQWVFGVCPLEEVRDVFRTNFIISHGHLNELAKTWLKKFQEHFNNLTSKSNGKQ